MCVEYKSIIMQPHFTVEDSKVYEAYIEPCDAGPWQYQYRIADHLGNTRVVFADLEKDGVVDEGDILQQIHYDPFGREITGPWLNSQRHDYQYQYNGKELTADFGLGWSDYGERMMDHAIGRFTAVDRFADKYYFQSQFVYAVNNPIKYIDINGNKISGFLL